MGELLYYDEEEEWNRALLLYDAVLKEISTKLEILNNEFKLAHRYNPIEHITSRIKSASSIARKIRIKGKELTVENILKYINDVAGVRIICSFTSDIYRIADAIAKQDDVTVLKVKDYIANPKPNGYMSYHMIVSIPIFLSNDVIDTKVEIQIRTLAMNFWSTIEHSLQYKYKKNIPDHIREKLTNAANAIISLDNEMSSVRSEIMDAQNSSLLHSRIVADILNNIQNLYRIANQREVHKIQDEFYRIYELNDIDQLKRFSRELDIISEGYRAQSVPAEDMELNLKG